MNEQVVPDDSFRDNLKSIEYIGFRTSSDKVIQISTEELTESLQNNCDSVCKIRQFSVSGTLLKQLSSIIRSTLNNDSKIFKKPLKVTNFKVPAKRENVENIEPSQEEKRRKLDSTSNEYKKDLGNVFNPNANEDKKVDHFNENYKKSAEQPFIGFKTANGKDIVISEQALKLVRSRWNEEDCISSSLLKGESTVCSEYDLNAMESKAVCEKETFNGSLIGFKTASGKDIHISEDSLKQVKSMWKDDELDSCFNSLLDEESTEQLEEREANIDKTTKAANNEDTEVERPCIGFKTASGKNIHISEEALEKIRSRMEDEEMEITCSDSVNKNLSRNITDSIKDVDVVIGKEISRSGNVSEGNTNSFVGFQTASGKSITISEEALRHVRNRWKEEEDSSESLIDTEKLNYFCSKGLKETNETPIDNFETDKNNAKAIKRKLSICIKSNINEGIKVSKEHEKNQWKDINLEVGSDATLTSSLNSNAEDDDWLEDAAILCDVLQARERERNNQKEFILSKTDSHEEFPSNEVAQNTGKRMTLKEALKSTKTETSICLSLNNSLAYEFSCGDSSEIFKTLSNGTNLIWNSGGKAGWEEFHNALRASPGVNPAKVHHNWTKTAYGLIVWKLSNYERYSSIGRSLMEEEVLRDLLLRYRLDLERRARNIPVLRSILNKDVNSAIPVVLLVCARIKDSITLSDGHYCIRADLDELLLKQARSGKIRNGAKLIVANAKMIGEACEPWEDEAQNVRFQLSFNSTRRAAGWLKLGHFHKFPILPLNSLKCGGGYVTAVDVVIERIHAPCMVGYRKKERIERGLKAASMSDPLENDYECQRATLRCLKSRAKCMLLLRTSAESEQVKEGLSYRLINFNVARRRDSIELRKIMHSEIKLLDSCCTVERFPIALRHLPQTVDNNFYDIVAKLVSEDVTDKLPIGLADKKLYRYYIIRDSANRLAFLRFVDRVRVEFSSVLEKDPHAMYDVVLVDRVNNFPVVELTDLSRVSKSPKSEVFEAELLNLEESVENIDLNQILSQGQHIRRRRSNIIY
ncbi:DgyrCDS9953 [Dimorphilus gyrociliatus]|uniref:DgyrCDS9953 n=1 Tax=Dimorphilus gyrociliatus TaxID=2664684 RepID=A0A7I8W001_9ANNE|nr:DgyrCDS9953 [Dimorphilus gyrociliatus]